MSLTLEEIGVQCGLNKQRCLEVLEAKGMFIANPNNNLNNNQVEKIKSILHEYSQHQSSNNNERNQFNFKDSKYNGNESSSNNNLTVAIIATQLGISLNKCLSELESKGIFISNPNNHLKLDQQLKISSILQKIDNNNFAKDSKKTFEKEGGFKSAAIKSDNITNEEINTLDSFVSSVFHYILTMITSSGHSISSDLNNRLKANKVRNTFGSSENAYIDWLLFNIGFSIDEAVKRISIFNEYINLRTFPKTRVKNEEIMLDLHNDLIINSMMYIEIGRKGYKELNINILEFDFKVNSILNDLIFDFINYFIDHKVNPKVITLFSIVGDKKTYEIIKKNACTAIDTILENNY